MKIVAAAIKFGDLIVIAEKPGRHHTIINGLDRRLGSCSPDNQGFITDEGKFVSRKEAFKIAQEANQIIEKQGKETELYSEDLW